MVLSEWIKLHIHRFLNRRYAIILTYHSVIDEPLEFNVWTHMPVSLFEQHMETLSSMSNVVPLCELIKQVKNGNLKDNLVAVTFDDGFRNNFTQAYPILEKHGVPATIFLTTDYINSNRLFWPERILFQLMKTTKKKFESIFFNDLLIETSSQKQKAYRKMVDQLKMLSISNILSEIVKIEEQLGAKVSPNDPLFNKLMPITWGEVETMEKKGLISFGGHTASHAILSKNSLAQAYNEMESCKKTLDEHLFDSAKIWSYPNGLKNDFNPINKSQLIDIGFTEGIFTMEPEFISAESNINELGRFGIGSSLCRKDLKSLLSKRNRIAHLHGVDKILQLGKNILP